MNETRYLVHPMSISSWNRKEKQIDTSSRIFPSWQGLIQWFKNKLLVTWLDFLPFQTWTSAHRKWGALTAWHGMSHKAMGIQLSRSLFFYHMRAFGVGLKTSVKPISTPEELLCLDLVRWAELWSPKSNYLYPSSLLAAHCMGSVWPSHIWRTSTGSHATLRKSTSSGDKQQRVQGCKFWQPHASWTSEIKSIEAMTMGNSELSFLWP